MINEGYCCIEFFFVRGTMRVNFSRDTDTISLAYFELVSDKRTVNHGIRMVPCLPDNKVGKSSYVRIKLPF